MSEKIVVVVGSSVNAGGYEYDPNYFWVIDFSNAPTGAPGTVQVQLPFSGSGCVVDCSETLAAVGNSTGPGYVTIYDISAPATPQSIGSTGTLSLNGSDFNGIGAIAFYAGYVLAAEANGTRVALIEIGSLGSPQVYETGLDTLSDVAVFGQYAVVCGTSVYHNAFQAANVNNLSSLRYGASTFFSEAVENELAVTCDFDGTNAVFSDGSGVYVFGISDGNPTANPVVPSGGASGSITSVTIAESQNAEGEYSGGVMTACAGPDSSNVDLTFFVPVTPEAKEFGASGSLGEPIIADEQIAESGGAAKFSRTINGTSALLAAAGVTANAAGVQEYVVTLFKVETAFSGGKGSITLTRQGQRATVPLPSTLDATLGIATFYKFPMEPFPIPHLFVPPIEEL